METKLKLNQLLSILFICLATLVYSQDVDTQRLVGDVVYEEYRENGIDKALEKYRDLKKNQSSQYDFTEWELNRVGYQIMQNEADLEAAEKVFKLNMEEYPEAANPHDSYADYLIANGDKEAAKKYLEKAISMAQNSDREDEKDIMKMSKAKLAKLDDQHKQLDFLVGNWNVKGTSFSEGLGSGVSTGRDEYVQNENENMITINHLDQNGEVTGKRIMVYDANKDMYDIAYINTNAPMGIEISSLKLKNLGNNKYELTEQNEGRERVDIKVKHELKKNPDGSMDWVIFESEPNTGNWKKVYAMEMRKDNL